MLKKTLLITLICTSILSIISNAKVIAQDTKPDAENNQISSAVKAIVENGVVKYSEGVQLVKVGLEWNPLPVNQALIDSLTQYKKAKDSLQIVNIGQANNGKAISCGLDRNSPDQAILYEALGVDKNSNCEQLSPDTSIQEKEIEALFNNEGISHSEYISMIKERNILKTILLSKGIEYAFNIRKDNELEVPDFSDKKISWQIKIYKHEWPSAKDHYYYRFNIKAIIEPFENKVVSKKEAVKEIKFDTRIRIKDLNKQTSIPNRFFSVTKLDGDGLQVASNPETEAISKKAASDFSKLSGVFNIIGGGTQLGTATQGIFGGADNSSFVSGGLVNFDNGNIDPLLGVNQEIGKIGDISAGMIFGVGLGEKTSIFLGPSLQSSIFTISAGATLGAKSQQSDLGFAGLVSVDLSRLSGERKEVNTINVDNPIVGSPTNIRQEIDNEANSNALIRYTILPNTNQERYFDLVRICDETGKKTNNLSELITINENNKPKIAFLRKGKYAYKIPASVSVLIDTGSNSSKVKIDPTSSLDFTINPYIDNYIWEFTGKIFKANKNSNNSAETKLQNKKLTELQDKICSEPKKS
jgi:hypothetical protein